MTSGIGTSTHLDNTLVQQRVAEIRNAATSLGTQLDDASLLSLVLAQSDVWTSASESEWSEEEWNSILHEVEGAIQELDSTRRHEGAVLEQDFHKHVDLIEQYLNRIPQYESERIDTARERINSWIAEAGIKEIAQMTMTVVVIVAFMFAGQPLTHDVVISAAGVALSVVIVYCLVVLIGWLIDLKTAVVLTEDLKHFQEESRE